MTKAQRQHEIVNLLGRGGMVTVADLAEKFNISPLTARRDLMDLQAQGLLSRTRGGAMLDETLRTHSRYELGSYEERVGTHGQRKRRIAERAAELVGNGDCLFLNAGSTTTAFAHALRQHQGLHVATNGLTVALELGHNPSTSIYLLAGEVEKKKMATLFDPEAASVASLRAPLAFLGVVAVDSRDGPLMLSMQEARMMRAVLDSAAEVTLLVDSSKFEATAMYRIAPLARLHRIVTDDALPAADRERIEAAGVELITVPADEDPAPG